MRALAEAIVMGETVALPGAGVPWLDARRSEAIAAFRAKGVPHRRIEEWKYSDLKAALEAANDVPIGTVAWSLPGLSKGVTLFDLADLADAPDGSRPSSGRVQMPAHVGRILRFGAVRLRPSRSEEHAPSRHRSGLNSPHGSCTGADRAGGRRRTHRCRDAGGGHGTAQYRHRGRAGTECAADPYPHRRCSTLHDPGLRRRGARGARCDLSCTSREWRRLAGAPHAAAHA